jgi:hypothetical protein
MKQIPQTYPFYLYDVPNHAEVKPLILESIKSMGTHCVVKEGQQISNTDWHLSPERERPYFEYVKPIIDAHTQALTKSANLFESDYGIKFTHYWFQQYAKGDYHTWHIHEYCLFANVYYVDLPDGAAKTSFKVGDKEFEVEVAEGQILTFPSCFFHCSKPNPAKTKTVISFNY